MLDKPRAEEWRKIGFPDTEDKLNQCDDVRSRCPVSQHNLGRLIVLDDFHLVEDPAVTRFVERAIYSSPSDRSFVIICREYPRINIMSLEIKNLVCHIHEEDLNFTENELAQYLSSQRLSTELSSDTCAFW